MAKVLNRHSQIFMPGETHFFPDIYTQRKQLGELPSDDVAQVVMGRILTLYARYNEPADQQRVESLLNDIESRERFAASFNSYRDVLTQFMGIQAELEGKLRWGNNTPKDLFYVDDILEFYPDAYIIVCIRDPRDFLKSYRGKWKVTADSEVGRLKALYHPVVTSVLWKTSMRRVAAIRSKVASDHLMVVRYEEFASNPGKVVSDVCDLIGENYEPQMLDVSFSNSSDQSGQSGIYAASVGSWRGQLTAEEIWIAQHFAGKEMAEFNYPMDVVRPNPLRLISTVLSTPWALWCALRANRANTGPIVPYLIRRLSGLVGRQ